MYSTLHSMPLQRASEYIIIAFIPSLFSYSIRLFLYFSLVHSIKISPLHKFKFTLPLYFPSAAPTTQTFWHNLVNSTHSRLVQRSRSPHVSSPIHAKNLLFHPQFSESEMTGDGSEMIYEKDLKPVMK